MDQVTLAESIYERTMASFKDVFDPQTGRVVDFLPGTSLVREFEASGEKIRALDNDEQGEINRRYYKEKIKTQSATNAEILDLAYGITSIEKDAHKIPYRVAVDVHSFHDKKSTEQSNPLLMDIIKLQKNYASISNYSKNLKENIENEYKFSSYVDTFNASVEEMLKDGISPMKKKYADDPDNQLFYKAICEAEQAIGEVSKNLKQYKKIQERALINTDSFYSILDKRSKRIVDNYLNGKSSTAATFNQLKKVKPSSIEKILPDALVNFLSKILPKSVFEKASDKGERFAKAFNSGVAVAKYKKVADPSKKNAKEAVIESTNNKLSTIKEKAGSYQQMFKKMEMTDAPLVSGQKINESAFKKIIKINQLKVEVDAASLNESKRSANSPNPRP